MNDGKRDGIELEGALGEEVGLVVAMIVEGVEGALVGTVGITEGEDGTLEETAVGLDGEFERVVLGRAVGGARTGNCSGVLVGAAVDGAKVGDFEGNSDGLTKGDLDGVTVGEEVDGLREGITDGSSVDGLDDGSEEDPMMGLRMDLPLERRWG